MRFSAVDPSSWLWLWAVAALGVGIGAPWDISWDASIGRHSWASPPHLLLNLSAIVVLLSAIAQRRREPVAAWLGVLGGLAMLASEVHAEWFGPAPMQADSAAGWAQLTAIGGMFLVVTAAIVATIHAGRRSYAPIVSCIAFVLLTATALSPYALPNLQRTALFAQLSAAAVPLVLVFAQQVLPQRASASLVALGYMLGVALLVWLLPLWPARPEVAPVFQQIEALLPPRFPLLLILPALALDLSRSAIDALGVVRHLARGAIVLATLLSAQWYFAAFLLAPASDHWFFAGGGEHWPYYLEIGAERAAFWGMQESPLDMGAVAVALLLATISAAIGELLGRTAVNTRAGAVESDLHP